MSLIDSEAAFEKRCNELLDGLHDQLVNLQITTFSSLAFAVGTPQQNVAEQEMQRFCDRVVLGPASIAEVSIIKRLHFESQTLLMADVRRQAVLGDTTEPSKLLPFIEKRRSLEAQQLRITGLSHMHEQKASHALIDLCFNIVETGALVYVAPSRCTTRDSEVQNEAKVKQKQLITLEQGSLKTVPSDGLSTVDVGTEMKLMYAFQRRGLAFDLADQELFTLLASEFDGPLKAPAINMDPPLDAQVRLYMNDPRITMHLVATPRVEKRAAPAASAGAPKQPPPKKPRSEARPAAQLPTELQGLHSKTADNKPLCLDTSADGSGDTAAELAAASTPVAIGTGPVHARAISCLSDLDFDSQQSALRRSACIKWLGILNVCLSASDVGRNIAALVGDEDNAEALEIIAAVIGVRSYHTAICRANAVSRYLRHVLEAQPDVSFPFSEELFWRYFQHLKFHGAPTTASAMLSAIRYSKFVMGFECMDKILASKRLKGLSDILFTNKRKLQQALVLTVQQVKVLHDVLDNSDADDYDRAAAAFLLTALYGRCRASDLACIESIAHDHGDQEGGYIELFTAVHKTGRSAVRKTTLLPILVPAFGINGKNWAESAQTAFYRVGLSFSGVVQGPLLRPPSHEGPFLCQRGVTSAEIGRLLRGLIGLDVEVLNKAVPHVSAHSLKATGLAWSARFGLSWPDRAILGRHQSHTNEAVAIYSRDLAVGPVSRFALMLGSIRQGTFCPDAARSKYFPFPPACPDVTTAEGAVDLNIGSAGPTENAEASACKVEVAVEGNLASEVIAVDSESDSSESASNGSSIASETEDDDPSPPPLKKGRVMQPSSNASQVGGSWVVHKKSGLLHHCVHEPSGGDANRHMTSCGRTVTANYEAMKEATEGNAICVICQRRKG
eukprot:s605_g20.t1